MLLFWHKLGKGSAAGYTRVVAPDALFCPLSASGFATAANATVDLEKKQKFTHALSTGVDALAQWLNENKKPLPAHVESWSTEQVGCSQLPGLDLEDVVMMLVK